MNSIIERHSIRKYKEVEVPKSIGASIENMLLKATEIGLGTLWIANTCFAYKDLVSFIGEEGQLVGAISVCYADEALNPRPRKAIDKGLGFHK